MKSLLLIAIGSALVNNVVLSQFLGLCPFLGVSKKVETAAGMGAAVLFVITIASAVTNLIYTFLLVPTDLTYLNTIVFILVIAALGFLIAIVILAGIREKMEYNNIPESFKGMPITLLTAGLMAIAFFGFSGLI